MKISFTVNDLPQPGGSKRGFVNPKTGRVIITEANAKSAGWRAAVIAAAKQAWADAGMSKDNKLQGPLRLRLTFFMARPKGHYGTGKNAGVLKPNAPDYHTTRPDRDKLSRSTCDALTLAGVWHDDAQVCDGPVIKCYGNKGPCAYIEIEEIESGALGAITPQRGVKTMSEQTQTAVAKREDAMPAVYRLPDIHSMAKQAFSSNLYPVKSEAQAFAVLMTAQSRGMHPWAALEQFHVMEIQGKVRLSMKAEAMLAHFHQAGGHSKIVKNTATECDIELSHERGGTFLSHYDTTMAERAGLLGKDVWKKYPEDMLFARAVSRGIRKVLPEAVLGIYTPEETEEILTGRMEGVDDGKTIDMPAGGFQDVSAPFKPGLPAQGVKVPENANGTAPAANQPTPEPPKRMSLEQRKKIFAMLKSDKAAFQAVITSVFNDSSIRSTRDLTAEQAEAIIEYLEGQKADAKEGELVEELNLDNDPFTGEKDVIE